MSDSPVAASTNETDAGALTSRSPSSLQQRLQLAWYRYPLLWLLLPILVGNRIGTATGRWLSSPSTDAIAWGLLVLLAISIWYQPSRVFKFGLSWVAAMLIAGGLGCVQALWQTPQAGDALSPFATRQSEAIAVEGTIASAAEWRPNLSYRPDQQGSEAWVTTWDIDCSAVRDRTWIPIQARSSLTVPGRITDLLPGDSVRVYGTFRAITEPTNPGAFNFSRQSQEQGKFVRIAADNRQQVEKLGLRPSYFLLRCRGIAVRAVDSSLRRWIAFDQSALAAALIFGQRSQVDWEERQELMATGTLHLLAISGLHVAIVASAVYLLCKLLHLPNRVQFWAIVACCGLYAALAGGQPPVLRAVVLISLIALSRSWGRIGRLTNLLCGAAILLLFLNAHSAHDVGVHLSFMAVASIGVFSAPTDPNPTRRDAVEVLLEQQLPFFPRWLRRMGRSILAASQISGWVWLLTCPLIWINFHVVSPIAVPLNVIVAFPLTISLLTGLLTGLLGPFIPPLAAILGWISGVCLAWISWIVQLGSNIPYGHWWLPAPPLYWTIVFYFIAAVWLLWFGARQRRWLVAILSLWLAFGVGLYTTGPRGYATRHHPQSQSQTAQHISIGTSSAQLSARSLVAAMAQNDRNAARKLDELCITFLDVGHGTSVVIEFPDGTVWLYDAGRFGAAETSFQDIATALWSLPTARIDTLIVSHADSDHYNAVQGLLARFNVGRVVSTDRFWNSPAPEVQQVHQAIRHQGIPIDVWQAGDAGHVGNAQWRVLHPSDSMRAESDNASSLCLLLQYASKNVFLPGDLEGTGMLELITLPPRPCHVLMAPHHGSISHDPRNMLDWCVPQTIVISGNQRAIRSEVLERFRTVDATLAVTFRDGAVQIRIAEDGTMSRYCWQGHGWELL